MSFGSKRTIGLVGCAKVDTVAKTTQWCGLVGRRSLADGILLRGALLRHASDMPANMF
jgi:hypothetical protein